MGFLVMANLELFVWCFFVSFIPNDYIFFSWPGDGVLFIIFCGFFTSHFFWEDFQPIFTSIFVNWVGTNHQRDSVDLDPQGVVFFFPSNRMSLSRPCPWPPPSSFRFCRKEHGKNTRNAMERDGDLL